jgi:Protein of unknown function (DUF732)
MKALGRNWRYQPLTVRLLAASAGLLTAAAAFAAPADAGPMDDAFIGALRNGGVNFGDQGNAVSLGQSVCPMLSRPGGNFAAAAARVRGGGISPGMAEMFTTIAIQMYCPTMMGNIASGNIGGGMPGIPGMPGMGGGIPGIGGGIPGMGGGMGGLPGMPGI